MAQAQLELLHEKTGQYGVMVRRTFPVFDSVAGLRMALSLKIKVSSVLGCDMYMLVSRRGIITRTTLRAFYLSIERSHC